VSSFYCYLVVDNSFDAPEDSRDYERILDTPTFNEVWADMEKVLATGKVKAIGMYIITSDNVLLTLLWHKGVSNFSIKT
jgi:hypothetical protein